MPKHSLGVRLSFHDSTEYSWNSLRLDCCTISGGFTFYVDLKSETAKIQQIINSSKITVAYQTWTLISSFLISPTNRPMNLCNVWYKFVQTYTGLPSFDYDNIRHQQNKYLEYSDSSHHRQFLWVDKCSTKLHQYIKLS